MEIKVSLYDVGFIDASFCCVCFWLSEEIIFCGFSETKKNSFIAVMTSEF